MKRCSNKGMTFIEVLIGLFILVTGVLGAVAMQASAKKGSFDAMQRSLASALAQDIIDRMRSNDPTQLASYVGSDYGVTLNAEPSKRCNSTASLCLPAEMVTNDLYEWELALTGADVKNGTSNAGGLVGATGCIGVSDNAITVVITWEGRTKIQDGQKDGSNVSDCGGSTANKKRRQVLVEAFVS
ncbi:type IV pilus modification protein PilV [Thalassotalea insulae]|uniref:Type IV pilus modification protein PilV n=1 Tax=Thalassotalea insulae TaxID=2056778 RepID=A0ABQ6GPB6_9GAMM|nr:type IV pilus modification protein PilV [Thalassotalea insulae]GLX77164.1 type IV pilus modification protein PilV [Thalassotalea insulae]